MNISPESIGHVKDFLDALFAEFETFQVRFHFLNWDQAGWNGKDDIDILVDPLSSHLAVALCASVGERYNIAIVSETKSNPHHHVFMVMLSDHNLHAVGIHLDFQVAIAEGGFCFAEAQQFLEPLQQESAQKAERLHEAILIFVRAIAGKGSFKPGYWERVQTAYHSSPNTFIDLLERYYGPALSEAMHHAICNNHEGSALQLRPAMFKWAKHQRRQTKKPLINRAASRIARSLSPKGIWIGITSKTGGKHRAAFEHFMGLITLPAISCEYVRIKKQDTPARKSRRGSSSALSSLAGYIRNILPVTSRSKIAVSLHETVDENRGGPHLLVSFDTNVAVADAHSSGHRSISELGQDNARPVTSLVSLFKTVTSAKRLKRRARKANFPVTARRREPFIISVVGMDGSGKGTYIGKLLEEFSYRGLDSNVVYLGYADYKKPVMQKIDRVRHEHPNQLLRRVLAILFLMLLPWEFRARAKNQNCDVLITDRHPFYEPVAKGYVTKVFDQLFRLFLPVPDVVLYLTGDTETLWKRKKEYSFEAFKQKASRLQAIVEKNNQRYSTVAIDTTQEMRHVLNSILKSVELDVAGVPQKSSEQHVIKLGIRN